MIQNVLGLPYAEKQKKRTYFPAEYFKQVITLTNLILNTPTI